MNKLKHFNSENKPDSSEKNEIIEFLYEELEKYGDPKQDIQQAVNYALKETPSFGGFVLVSYDNNKISGAVVVNETGMKGYIPENILVYIATAKSKRGQGIGKELLDQAVNKANGAVALHCEPDNPALKLYQKAGFSNKYLEMRFSKN
ncbi:MAG: GNAT family N-acetyltransferase [Brumimicrobium sp.]|nr:GNAT family N-acetyltransferase [Brumimicrobium sp.]